MKDVKPETTDQFGAGVVRCAIEVRITVAVSQRTGRFARVSRVTRDLTYSRRALS